MVVIVRAPAALVIRRVRVADVLSPRVRALSTVRGSVSLIVTAVFGLAWAWTAGSVRRVVWCLR